MTEKYPRGDPTPIMRSIEQAAKILRALGVNVELRKELPHASDQNYWQVLNNLHNKLWRMVYAKNPKTADCEVTHVHDDGDTTLKCDGIEHVATTEGKLYREISDIERLLVRLCKNGPVTNSHNRRLIPEYAINETEDYIISHTKNNPDVDPEFVSVLAKGSDRMMNKSDAYDAARKELLQLLNTTLAKSDPSMYDKFKRCLEEV